MVPKEPESEVAESLVIVQQEINAATGIIASLLDFAQPKKPVLRHVEAPRLLLPVEEAIA